MPGHNPKLLVLGQLNHIHVIHMSYALAERGFDVVIAGQSREGFGEIPEPEHGVELIELPSASGRTIRGISSQVRAVRRVIRAVRPDVVFGHWLCGYAAFAAVAGARPLASMAWGSDVLLANRFQRLANKIALRRSALAVGDSQNLCSAMAALGGDPASIVNITWGVDMERFSPAPDRAAIRVALGLPEGRLVLSPRSLLPVYNPEVVLAAFELVAERVPDAHFVMLSLYDGAHDLGPFAHHDRMHVVGHVPYEQMPDYLRAADVSVSIPSSDGSPRTVWEAMACGSPVVLSDLPWVYGELDPATEAVVVPIDAKAVADAVVGLLEDPVGAAAMAARARALTAEKHDVRLEMDRLATLMHALV